MAFCSFVFFFQPLPIEISSQLFHEEEMKFLYKKLEPIINWGKVRDNLYRVNEATMVGWSIQGVQTCLWPPSRSILMHF